MEGLILRILGYANSKCFCLRSNLSNDDIISAQNPGLKTGVENDIFWSEIGPGFGEPGGTPPPWVPRSTPPPVEIQSRTKMFDRMYVYFFQGFEWTGS